MAGLIQRPGSASGVVGAPTPMTNRERPSPGPSRANPSRSSGNGSVRSSANGNNATARPSEVTPTTGGPISAARSSSIERAISTRSGRPAIAPTATMIRPETSTPACFSRTSVSGRPAVSVSSRISASSAIPRTIRWLSSRRARCNATMAASSPTASTSAGSHSDQVPSTTTNQVEGRCASEGPAGKTLYAALPRPAATAGSRSAVRKVRVTRSRSAGGSGVLTGDDRPSRRRQHPAGQAGLLLQLPSQLAQVTAVSERAEQPALAAERRPELSLPGHAHRGDDLLGDLREGHLVGDPDDG